MVRLVGECFMFASVLIHWFWLFSQFWNDLFSKLISLATCWERLLSSVEPTFPPIGEHCFSWGRRRQHLAQWRPIFPRAAWNGCAHHKQTRIFGGRRWSRRSQPPRSSPGPSFPLAAQHIWLVTLPGGGEGSAGRRRPLQRRRSQPIFLHPKSLKMAVFGCKKLGLRCYQSIFEIKLWFLVYGFLTIRVNYWLL